MSQAIQNLELEFFNSDFGKSFTSKYVILSEIHRTDHSLIYEVKVAQTQALKVLKIEQKIDNYNYDQFYPSDFRHDNLIRIDEIGISDNFVYSIMEKLTGATLDRYLQLFGPFPVVHSDYIIEQLISIVTFLNRTSDASLFYRVINASKLMISLSGKITLIDPFSINSQFKDMNSDTYIISKNEYIRNRYNENYSRVTNDIYSMGEILFRILTGQAYRPFLEKEDGLKYSFIPSKYKNLIIKSTHLNLRKRFKSVSEFTSIFCEDRIIRRVFLFLSHPEI
jgi:hypothetical protein